MKHRLNGPIRVNFEITEACPLSCSHCYARWGVESTDSRDRRTTRDEKDEKGGSRADLERVLQVLVQQRVQVITFTGGEPLSRKDLLFPLLEKAKTAGIRVLVNTSAALLTSADALRFVELGVDGFLVSLMSSEERTHNKLANANSHARTIRGIRLLISKGLSVTINMVCSRVNFDQVRQTAQYVSGLGATMFAATPVLPTPDNANTERLHLNPSELRQVMFDLAWARENLPIRITTLDPVAHCQFDAEERAALGDLLRERYCCAGISDCAISANGDMRACIMTPHIGGNILTDGWEASWESLASWSSVELLPEACRTCSLVDQCGGGCRTAAEAIRGSLKGKDPYMVEPVQDVAVDSPSYPSLSPSLAPDRLLSFSADVSTRPESFGGTLFLRGKATFLKTTPFDLVTEQVARGPFTPRDWSSSQDLDLLSVTRFLEILVADGFVQDLDERR